MLIGFYCRNRRIRQLAARYPSASAMCPQLDLEPYRREITQLAGSNCSHEAIRIFLLHTHGVCASTNTISRRLQSWGLRTRRLYLPAGARDAIVCELLRLSLSTEEILMILAKKGMPSSERTLRRTRKKLGIRLRIDDPREREAQEEEVELILMTEDQIGEIEGYSRRLQRVFLRRHRIFISE